MLYYRKGEFFMKKFLTLVMVSLVAISFGANTVKADSATAWAKTIENLKTLTSNVYTIESVDTYTVKVSTTINGQKHEVEVRMSGDRLIMAGTSTTDADVAKFENSVASYLFAAFCQYFGYTDYKTKLSYIVSNYNKLTYDTNGVKVTLKTVGSTSFISSIQINTCGLNGIGETETETPTPTPEPTPEPENPSTGLVATGLVALFALVGSLGLLATTKKEYFTNI